MITTRRSGMRTAVVATVIAALVAAGCSTTASSSAPDTTTTTTSANGLVEEGIPVRGGNLVIGVRAETSGWNPGSDQWAQEGHTIGSTMFEPLFTNNAEGEPVPWLAESATSNEDHTLWHLTVRQGIKFHDGTALDASAVVKSLTFMLSDKALSSFAYGTVVQTPVVTGEYSFDVPLSESWGALPQALTTGFGYVMAPAMIDGDPDKPVGTGAYTWASGETGRSTKVTAFDSYWGGPCTVVDPAEDIVSLCSEIGVPLGQPNGPWLTTIEFKPIVDSVQQANALRTGDVDAILTAAPDQVHSLRYDGYQVVTDYTSENFFAMTNTTKAPFDNIHARRALAFATDRHALLDAVGGGEDIASQPSPFEAGTSWATTEGEATYPTFDIEQSKAEVEAYKADMATAGTPVDALSLELTGIANSEETTVEQLLQQQWAAAGIETKISTIAQEALINIVVGGDWDAMLFRNYAYPDPDNNYIFWSEQNATGSIPINFTGFYNDITEASIGLGRRSSDAAFRQQAYSAFVAERNRNAVDIWLYNTPWALVAEPDVRGLNPFRALGMGALTSRPYITGLWVNPTP